MANKIVMCTFHVHWKPKKFVREIPLNNEYIWYFLGEDMEFLSISRGFYEPSNNHSHESYRNFILIMWHVFETYVEPSNRRKWDYIFKNFCLKLSKNTCFGLLWLYKCFSQTFLLMYKLKNEYFNTSWDSSLDQRMVLLAP